MTRNPRPRGRGRAPGAAARCVFVFRRGTTRAPGAAPKREPKRHSANQHPVPSGPQPHARPLNAQPTSERSGRFPRRGPWPTCQRITTHGSRIHRCHNHHQQEQEARVLEERLAEGLRNADRNSANLASWEVVCWFQVRALFESCFGPCPGRGRGAGPPTAGWAAGPSAHWPQTNSEACNKL